MHVLSFDGSVVYKLVDHALIICFCQDRCKKGLLIPTVVILGSMFIYNMVCIQMPSGECSVS
jgi:hypothetical protein